MTTKIEEGPEKNELEQKNTQGKTIKELQEIAQLQNLPIDIDAKGSVVIYVEPELHLKHPKDANDCLILPMILVPIFEVVPNVPLHWHFCSEGTRAIFH